MPPTLYIDADACPVIRPALACARATGVPCTLVADEGHDLSRLLSGRYPTTERRGFWVRTVTVVQGPDAADFEIVSSLEPGDVVLTSDIGLASMVLGRGGRAIDFTGYVFDARTIDSLLLLRHATKREISNPRRRGRPKIERHRSLAEDGGDFNERLTRLLREAKQGCEA